MANTTLTTDLNAMHAAIVADIQAAFPGFFQTVEFYDENRQQLPLPACILELDEMPSASGDDPGNGQKALEARFCAHLALGFTSTAPRLNIRLLAASFAAFLHEHKWTGITSGLTEVHGAFPDDFMPEMTQFYCWKVDWSNVIWVGTDYWDETGFTTPTTVFVGVDPFIGPGNEGDYIKVLP